MPTQQVAVAKRSPEIARSPSSPPTCVADAWRPRQPRWLARLGVSSVERDQTLSGRSGRTRPGNPPNGNAPRPAGACRVLMIGDMIGKPAGSRSRSSCRAPRGARRSTSSPPTARTSPAGWASRLDGRGAVRRGRRRDHVGNHIWDKREIYPYLESNDRVLRPLNYGTHGVPGRGWGAYQALDGTDLAVINLQGRTYMQQIENPFTDADRCSTSRPSRCRRSGSSTSTASSRRRRTRFGLHLDGRVSAVVGTHTHVVTGDERILPGGTAYQTDLGMTGPSGA